MTLFNIPGAGQLAAGVPFSMPLQFHDVETGEPFIDHVKFPANFIDNATEDDLARLGITIVVPEPVDPPEPEEPAE